jgi:hypothetical protein
MTGLSWLPNWENLEEYPKAATTRQWAWEFLRRNPKYIAACAETNNVVTCAKEFGLAVLVDPALPFAEAEANSLVFEELHIPSCVSHSLALELNQTLVPQKPTEVVMCFDLNLPIDLLLDAARAGLEMERLIMAGEGILSDDRLCELLDEEANPKAKKGRMQTKMFPRYLRLLDAELAGQRINAKFAEILLASENPDPEKDPGAPAHDVQKLKENLCTAHSWRDEGYKLLARNQFRIDRKSTKTDR